MQTVMPIIAESKMLFQQDRIDRIFVASRMLGREITKLIPISAFMQLTIAHREISKSIERCAISITLHGLLVFSEMHTLSLLRLRRV